jgi:signal transduction histidine kinase
LFFLALSAPVSNVNDGQRSVEVSALQSEPGFIRFQPRDNGTGIDPQHLPRLFDSFFSTKPEGIGIGLPISRSIIAAQGGRL